MGAKIQSAVIVRKPQQRQRTGARHQGRPKDTTGVLRRD